MMKYCLQVVLLLFGRVIERDRKTTRRGGRFLKTLSISFMCCSAGFPSGSDTYHCFPSSVSLFPQVNVEFCFGPRVCRNLWHFLEYNYISKL